MPDPSTRLRRGSIVWVPVADPRGTNVKTRPVVLVTAPGEIVAGGKVVGVAVTGTFAEPLPPECVVLPWNRQGSASTGLRKKCCAVCNWLVPLYAADLEDTGKYVPKNVM